MIIVDDVHKRYQTDHGLGKWVLQGVSFTIPAKTNVGLVGKNGAGKSTLLRIIGGVDQPTRGRVERHCRVSWPMGLAGGLQGSLTGRQNAKFVCRIHGHEDDIPERLAYIQAFAEIGDAFDEPIKTYSSGMQARLKFAISLAFDFDVYISDELTAVGDVAFRKKTKEAFKNLVDRSGLIMVSHQEGTLKEFCTAGIWLDEGQAHWFDNIDSALEAYRESQPGNAVVSRPKTIQSRASELKAGEVKNCQMQKKDAFFDKMQAILQKGLNGSPALVDHDEGLLLKRRAKQLGVELVPKGQIKKRGYRLKQNVTPILKKSRPGQVDKYIEFYDLKSQCVKVEES